MTWTYCSSAAATTTGCGPAAAGGGGWRCAPSIPWRRVGRWTRTNHAGRADFAVLEGPGVCRRAPSRCLWVPAARACGVTAPAHADLWGPREPSRVALARSAGLATGATRPGGCRWVRAPGRCPTILAGDASKGSLAGAAWPPGGGAGGPAITTGASYRRSPGLLRGRGHGHTLPTGWRVRHAWHWRDPRRATPGARVIAGSAKSCQPVDLRPGVPLKVDHRGCALRHSAEIAP